MPKSEPVQTAQTFQAESVRASGFLPIQSPSAERHRQLAAQGKRAATAKAAVLIPKIAKGDAITLVHANLGHVRAKVAALKGGGRIDLVTVDDDVVTNTPSRITDASYDPDGRQFDSWHVPESNPSSSAAGGVAPPSGNPAGGRAA
jgi:hypothetical protein